MPASRWLGPLFYVGTVPLLLALLVVTRSLHLPLVLDVVAYLLSPVGGFALIRLFLKWRPDARYLSESKEEGFGFVWNPMDALAPYLIFGFIVFGLLSLSMHH